MPIINQYVIEHSRTIKSVNATLDSNDRWFVMAYFVWSHPVSIPIYNENGTITGYKYPENINADSFILGFDVIINADNGQVLTSGSQGVW